MSTALSLIFENQNAMPLFLETHGIDGASWTKPLPEELKRGQTDDGYGVASTGSAFGCHFVYVAEGSHVLGVTIQVSESGGIQVDRNQSPPAQVAAQSVKHGDTWVVTLIYSGLF